MPKGAICVQRFDDSLNSAIHITYRISLRSSSMPEPRESVVESFNLFSFDSEDMFIMSLRKLLPVETGKETDLVKT